MKIETLLDPEAVAERAASIIAEDAWAAVAERGMFIMAVSGGHTCQISRHIAMELSVWF
jgi:6-phosphogluconolactonase/glucosamine-6-phosphate isomerase/deaminase